MDTDPAHGWLRCDPVTNFRCRSMVVGTHWNEPTWVGSHPRINIRVECFGAFNPIDSDLAVSSIIE